MSTRIDLPIVVCGQVRHPAEAGDAVVELPYSSDVTVRLPRLTDADLAAVAAHRESLQDVSFAEITRYLSAAGPACLDAGRPRTGEAIRMAERVTGYSRATLTRDWWIMGDFLTFRNNFYDLLDAELGTHRVLDEWVVNHVARIRAFPRGRVFHVLVGNVPMAGIYSVLRSILTRNQTVVKLPARDPVTCLQFARTLIEANPPDHPISRSLTLAYFDRDAPAFDALIAASDLVCAWGQGASLQAIKRRMPHSVPLLEFGPKRSLGVVFADEVDPEGAAMRIAHDVSVYDQEACFSPQRLFVVGDHRRLMAPLARWLDHQAAFLPKGAAGPDVQAHVVRTRLEARFRGWEVVEGGAWTLMVAEDPYGPIDHPLGRTLYVHPIACVRDMLPAIDDETQTVAVLPFHAHAREVADLMCARGAVRVCEGGLVSHFRQGFTHDGAYALRHFVRLAYMDESLAYTYKYGPALELAELERVFFGAGEPEEVDHVVG